MKSCLIRMRFLSLLRTALWAALGALCLASASAVVKGQDDPVGVCVDPRGCDPSPGSGPSDNSGASELGRRARGWIDCKLFGKDCPDKTEKRRAAANALNDQGIQAYNKGDWATAASYFQRALKKSPDDTAIRQNLANARANMVALLTKEKEQTEAAVRERESKAAASNIQQESIQDLRRRGWISNGSAGGDTGGLDSTPAAAAPSSARPASSENGNPTDPDALQQLLHVKAASDQAASTRGPAAKRLSANRFDTPEGPPAADLPLVKVPSPVNWEQIPVRLLNDPGFRAMNREWQELRSQKRVVDAELDRVRDEKSKPGADTSRLAMEEAGLKAKVTEIEYQKGIVEGKLSFAVDVAENEDTVKAFTDSTQGRKSEPAPTAPTKQDK